MLEHVAASPVFGRKGILITTPGYHAEDHLWLHQPADLVIEPVPPRPSREEVVRARQFLLDDLLGDFPFAGDADRSHALAAMLLPFIRRMITGCTPLHLVESTHQRIRQNPFLQGDPPRCLGTPCDARTMPSAENEIKKMIAAELRTGRQIILLDNITHRIDSGSLASVLTTTRWTDRRLGSSEMLSLPNNALWLLTGNNPDVSMEIARRSVRIRIDPKVDQPWLRQKFRHPDPEGWTTEHRPALVRAALVLIQAWIAAGQPRHPEKLGSFEEWSEVLGGVLDVAEVKGFLGNLQAVYDEADAEGQMWRRSWRPGGRSTAGSLCRRPPSSPFARSGGC